MHKTPWIIIAAILAFTIGAGFWIDRRFQVQPPQPSPVSIRSSFERWQGVDLSMDKDVVDMLKTDQILSRKYRKDDGQTAYLYGAFYLSQGADRTMHSPLNCYPGSGWEIVKTEEIELRGLQRQDVKILAQKALIRKGLLERDLYFWYYAAGRNASNQYLNKALTLYGAVFDGRTDGALVTISTGAALPPLGLKDFEKNFIARIIDDLAAHPVTRQ